MSALLQLFKEHKTKITAVYGLGVETEKVLPDLLQHFQLIGLLDGYRKEGELYGQPIISLSEAVRKQVSLILVVARPGSCKAIAKRIGKVCRENCITLLDIRGNDLLEKQRITYDFKNTKAIFKNELLYQIEKHDVISFDLFDTLLMRNTLFPTDVYEITEERLRKQKIKIDDFTGKRLESEKYLAQKGAFTLVEIYQYMLKQYHIEGVSAQILADMEWEVDKDLLLPRVEMCEIVSQIRQKGKDIYIVSDTYYTKTQLKYLLDKFGIIVKDILASCEFKTSKTQQLYRYLIGDIGNKTCLHIGDDYTADVEHACKYGLDAFKIYSGIELLESIGYMGMWELTESLADRIKVGMFIARIFNSPFQFEKTNKKIEISRSYDIGYLFAAPIITDFVIWFDKKVHNCNILNVWMGARDGYLLKKLYDYLKKEEVSIYFLTSRTAAIRAGMEKEKDIQYVEDMKFAGSLKEQLAVRFGIEAEPTDEKCLMDYKKDILEHSAILRENYQRYINALEIRQGNIAFFDFVAKGTTQMYLSKLTDHSLKGLYFLQLEKEYMHKFELDIETFYTGNEKEDSTILEDYYILETILTSPEPTVNEFDKKGCPVFAKETRSREDLECILEEQRGIFEYFETFLRLCTDVSYVENKKLDELLLGLFHKLDVTDEKFLNLKVEDPFFNRNTEIADLL